VIRHSTAKVSNEKSFEEGDVVVLYDTHRKLFYLTVVSEVLGTNNFLVLYDNGPICASGGVMFSSGQPVTVVPADGIEGNHNDTMVSDDDNVSVVSVISSDSKLDIPIVARYNNFKYKRKICTYFSDS